MADDIVNFIAKQYADIAKSESAISSGLSNINVVDENMTRAQKELLQTYIDQAHAIRKIGDTYNDVQNEIRDIAAKNYIFQQTEEEKLTKYKLNAHKQLYEYINDDNRKHYNKLAESEAKIYEQRIANGGKLTENELKSLKEIEINKIQLEENGTKKALERLKTEYKNKNNLNKQYLEELDKRELDIYKTRDSRGDEFTKDEIKRLKDIEKERLKTENKIKDEQDKNSANYANKLQQGIKRAINYVGELVSYYTDLMYFNPAKEGMTNFAQAYEQNFTELAGRFGTNRNQTHNLIGSGLSTVNNDEVLSKALDYSQDVIPSIVEASKSGFMGDEAIEIGISRALDKKIMPWLDTNSETWSHLEYNLSDDSLRQIKGQQLLLQETRAGNRILQTGVADTLLKELAPTLQSIDANTTTAESMGAAYEAVEQLMDRGMDKESAVRFVKDAIEAEKHTGLALASGDPAKVVMGMGAMYGGGVEGAIENYSRIWGNMLAGAQGDELAIDFINQIAGGYLAADSDNYASMFADLNITGKYNENSEAAYTDAANSAVEKVTATQEHDNKIRNDYAEKILFTLQHPHGSDIAIKTFDEVVHIKNWLIRTFTAFIADKISNLFTPGGGSNIGRSLLSSGKGDNGAILSPKASGALSGGLAATGGAITGIMYTNNESKAYTASHLEGKDVAKNTQLYKEYEKSLENKHQNKMIGAGVGGAIGVAGGAAAGAAIGSVVPVVGTAIGAVIGGAIGFIGSIVGAKAGESISELNSVISKAASDSLDSLDILKTNWSEEIVERQNLVSAMKDTTDIEVQKRMLLDAGIDKNLVSMAKTDEALDKLAATALKESQDDSKLANESAGFLLETNNQAGSALLDNVANNHIWDENDSGVMKERMYDLADVMSAAGVSKDDTDKIKENAKDSWWFGYGEGDLDEDMKDVKGFMTKEAAQNIAYTYGEEYDTVDEVNYNKLINAIRNKDKESAIEAIQMLKVDKVTGYDETTWEMLKKRPIFANKLTDMGIDIKKYALGSTYIPNDMIAELHAGERVLTPPQNKQYTEELVSGKSSVNVIQTSIQDVVIAIKNQTSEIINYLSTMSFSNSSFGNSQVNMLPSMGNTKVTF